MRVNSTTEVDTWYWERFTASAADMILVVEGEDIIAGQVENRVPKAVKVEVTAAKLGPGFAAACKPGDSSRAIVDPTTWKTK